MSPSTPEDPDKNLHSLSQKLEEHHKTSSSNSALSKEQSKKATGIGFRIGIELAAGIIIGSGFGLLIDHYFDTSPWGLIILFFLGSAAGFMNVYRAVGHMGYKVGYEKTEDKNPKDI